MKLLAIALSSTILVACGGGGGGGSVASSTGSTISGAAVKGPMSNAKISIYKVKVDGTKGDLLTTKTSGDDGSYSATINDYSGLVIVEATVTADTLMYDEATGQNIKPASDFVLRAIVSADAGKTVNAQINPFTESATAATILKEGGISKTNVEQANKDNAEFLGFDPLTTAATFDTNKKPTNAAGLMLAAVSQLAKEGTLTACAAAIDQASKVACVTKEIAAKGLGDPTVKATLNTQIDAVNTSLPNPVAYIPVGSPSGTAPSTASALDQTKDFMTTLRSNAKALDASDLSLKTEFQAVADDLKTRTLPIANSNINALDVASKGVEFWNEVVVKQSSSFVKNRGFFDGYTYLGGCTLYSDSNYDVEATSVSDAKFVACSSNNNSDNFIRAVDLNGLQTPCTAIGDVCATQWTTRVRLTPDASNSNKFTVYTKTRAAKLQKKDATDNWSEAFGSDGKAIGRVEYGAAFPGNAATLTTIRNSAGDLTSVSLTGELSPGFVVERSPDYSYDNVTAQWIYKPNAAVTVLGDKHNVSLLAAVTSSNGIDKVAISGLIESIKADTMDTRVELLDGSYLQATKDATSSYSVKDGNHEMLLKLKASTPVSAVTGELKVSAFKTDASGTSYQPTLIAFTGSVQRNGVSFFDGTLSLATPNYSTYNDIQALSASNSVTSQLGFDGKVTITNRPQIKVNLSVSSNNATQNGSISGQYSQGLIVINVSGTNTGSSEIVTLTSTNGIKLVMDKSKTTYPLSKGSDLIGTYSTIDNKLTYSDNSYEQF